MRLWHNWATALILSGLVAAPAVGRAATCAAQAEMNAQDRGALASAAQRLAVAVVQQDEAVIQSSLLPAVAPQWDGIRGAVEQGAAAVKGGQPQINSMYLLDATSATAPADTQFFCSNADGSMTVTITLGNLPPGKFAVAQVYVMAAPPAGGAPAIAGQVAFILGLDAGTWKLGGVFIRPAAFDGHDGVWYWQRARELSHSDSPWAAFYCYQAARYLLLPVDFISSPNLEKLEQEQAQVRNSPTFPYSVTAGDRTWKIDQVRFDPTLREPDLGVTYESAGVTDPAAQRTEAIAVLGALLKAQPTLRPAFHGLWAYASTNGKASPVMALPMNQIP
ncbi:MAG TPA: hypothetical protein VGJ21_07975 [Terracidiphilus sp.]|jgi:hypothetical protein